MKNSRGLYEVVSNCFAIVAACIFSPVAFADPIMMPGGPTDKTARFIVVSEDGTATLDGKNLDCPVVGGVPTCMLPNDADGNPIFVWAGDVVLIEGFKNDFVVVSDVLRFPDCCGGQADTFQLFSDKLDGGTDKNDVGLPSVDLLTATLIFEDLKGPTNYFALATVGEDGVFQNQYMIRSDPATDLNRVPEPGTLSVLCIGGIAWLRHLKRKRHQRQLREPDDRIDSV